MTNLNKSIESFNRLGQVGKIDYMKKIGFIYNTLNDYDFNGTERRFFRYMHINKLIDKFIIDFNNSTSI